MTAATIASLVATAAFAALAAAFAALAAAFAEFAAAFAAFAAAFAFAWDSNAAFIIATKSSSEPPSRLRPRRMLRIR